VAEVQPTSEVGTIMRRGYVVRMRWVVIYGYGVPGGALNLNYTNAQTMVTMGIPFYQGKIPMVEPGIEPGTSRSVVRNSDHEAGPDTLICFYEFPGRRCFLFVCCLHSHEHPVCSGMSLYKVIVFKCSHCINLLAPEFGI
jgi:hypothetical protein